MHGKVVKIASAAIPEEEAKRALANAAAAANVAQAPQSAPGQQEAFVFPVTVALDETAMKIDNALMGQSYRSGSVTASARYAENPRPMTASRG